MLSTYQQVELLVAGLHAPPAAGSEPMLSITAKDNPGAWAGFYGTLKAGMALYPETIPVTVTDDLEKAGWQYVEAGLYLDLAALFDTSEVTEWFLGSWAATGDRVCLAELVRRAKHRDGTSAAISVSSYAMELLRVAVETDSAFLAMLRELDYDPSNMIFGNYPVVQDAAPAALDEEIVDHMLAISDPEVDALLDDEENEKPTAYPITVIRNDPDPDYEHMVASATGSGPPPFPRVNVPLHPPDIGPVINVPLAIAVKPINETGRIVVYWPGFPAMEASITDARTLADSLERAIRVLLLPGEGYRWDDDATLGSSALVVFDPELVKIFEAFTSLNSADGPDAQGRFVLGNVTMESDGRFIGQVCTKVWRKERRGDMNSAKYYVAARVRHLLSDPAAQLAAGSEIQLGHIGRALAD